MADETWAGPVGEVRTISTAGGGTALTTTAAFITLIPGTRWVSITPRNFSTAVVAKIAYNPYLLVVKTTDALATNALATDASDAVQDQGLLATTTLVMNSFSTAAANNFLYVGAHEMFRGVRVIVGNTNSNASVITVKYWNSAWTDITATDGTANAGASFGQNGNVTWTVPTDWVPAPLGTVPAQGIADTTLPGVGVVSFSERYFWTRWQFSLDFDASVTATEMQAMNRNTAQYGELISGQTLETSVNRGPSGIGCIEALTDAGTANLVVNAATRGTGRRFAP